jgi:hypothetical protein
VKAKRFIVTFAGKPVRPDKIEATDQDPKIAAQKPRIMEERPPAAEWELIDDVQIPDLARVEVAAGAFATRACGILRELRVSSAGRVDVYLVRPHVAEGEQKPVLEGAADKQPKTAGTHSVGGNCDRSP